MRPYSLLHRITRPGSYIDFQYNARNWLTAVLNRTTGGTTRYDANYYYQDGSLWDHTGNPLKRVENIAGSTYSTTFRYDNVYRMIEETKRDSSNNVLYSLGYTYDSVGNRLSRTLGGVTTTYTYDNNDKLLNVNGSQSCWYDLNGNLTSTGVNLPTQSFAYDDENQLTSLTSGGVTNLFYYNALGQRYRARLNGTYWRYVYNGDRVLEETNDSGTVLARYTTASPSYFAPLLHMWRSTSTSRFPSYDLTGSARQLLDASGNVTDSYELDAFGRMVSSSGSTVNPYKYDAAWGYITDPSGFQQLGARFYWPEIGRFLQQDPIGEGMNWYGYVGGNPLTRIDPYGLSDSESWWHYLGHADTWTGPLSDAWNRVPKPKWRGPATMVAGAGVFLAGVRDAAKKGVGGWKTAGAWAKAGGIALSGLGGYLTYKDTRPKAIKAARPIRNGDRWLGEQDPSEPDPWEGLYCPSGEQYMDEE